MTRGGRLHHAWLGPGTSDLDVGAGHFLKGLGAVTVIAAGGVVWRAVDQGVFSAGRGPAYEPWETWDIDSGRALENMMLAAAANGYDVTLSLAEGELGPIPPDPAPVLVARLALRAGPATTGPLYAAIPDRHTDRTPYDTDRPLSPALAAALQAMPGDDDAIRVIHSRAEVQEYRDGPTLDAAGLPPLVTKLAKVMPAPSAETNHQYWLDATRDVHVATAQAFGLVLVRELYDRAASLRAGRIWQRMHLWATSQGLSMQPLNQPVERVDRERQLGVPAKAAGLLEQHTGPGDWRPTFAFRVGYPTQATGPSPRRPVELVVAG